MSFTELCKPIFVQSINDYHKTDNVDTPINNPYEVKSIEYYLYLKTGLTQYNGTLKTLFATRRLTRWKHWH